MNQNFLKISAIFGILAIVISMCGAIPKYDSNNSKGNQWKRSYKDNDTFPAATADRTERLGYTSGYGSSSGGYGGSVNGYSNSGVGPYAPMKIDLGGVILGAIIGIGALLIIPKFATALNGGYGGYGNYGGNYRSADSAVGESGISEMMAKLDEILGKNNIDSTVCMQRVVCNYVRQSTYHQKIGTADQSDQIVGSLSGNAIVEFMLNGTAAKSALENGKNLNAESCDKIYAGCPLDKQQALSVLSKLLPSAGSQ